MCGGGKDRRRLDSPAEKGEKRKSKAETHLLLSWSFSNDVSVPNIINLDILYEPVFDRPSQSHAVVCGVSIHSLVRPERRDELTQDR